MVQQEMIITNVGTYWEIAEEHYNNSQEIMNKNKHPKEGGGFIIIYDPMRTSFKSALISIVFYGMYLEAALNLTIGRKLGIEILEEKKEKFSPSRKLEKIGCSDLNLIERVKVFSNTVRNPIIHEKAHLDQSDLKKAQEEAKNARQLMLDIRAYFKKEYQEA